MAATACDVRAGKMPRVLKALVRMNNTAID
jgi:hypothetical protein